MVFSVSPSACLSLRPSVNEQLITVVVIIVVIVPWPVCEPVVVVLIVTFVIVSGVAVTTWVML